MKNGHDVRDDRVQACPYHDMTMIRTWMCREDGDDASVLG